MKLRTWEIPEFLQNVMDNYVSDTKIAIDIELLEVTAGVPQRSVLGPTLCNILYDGARYKKVTRTLVSQRTWLRRKVINN